MINPTCGECGNDQDWIGAIDGSGFWYCMVCAGNRMAEEALYHETMNEPEDEEAFHDTRREDWEREQYRRIDAEDAAEFEDDTDAG